MSDTLAAVRRKIRHTEEMRSMVRMMKAMTASSLAVFRQAEPALVAYHRTVELALTVCMRSAEGRLRPDKGRVPNVEFRMEGIQHSEYHTRTSLDFKNSTHGPQELAFMVSAPAGWIVLGTDQGMVGRFNEHLAEALRKKLGPEGGRLWVAGDRLRLRMEHAGLPLAGWYDAPQSVDAVGSLVGEILLDVERAHLSGKVGDVGLVYNAPVMGGGYETKWMRLLPWDRAWRDRLLAQPWPTRVCPEMVLSGEGAWAALVSEYMFVTMFRACVESCLAEHGARLAAMYRAEENIDDRRRDLDLEYNHRRQGAIDAELFDLIASYERR